MTPRARSLLALALLAGILALEALHAIRRVRSAAERSSEAVVAELRSALSREAVRLEDDLALGRAHARTLASLDSVRRLLEEGTAEAFDRAGRDAVAILVPFPSLGRAVLLDAGGGERLRVERVGAGVSLVPLALLRAGPSPTRSPRSREEPKRLDLEFEEDRVDVAERDRQVLRFAEPASEGTVVVSLYSAPLFEALRRTDPATGVVRFLVDGEGRYLAHPDRDREVRRGGGASFREDHPSAFDAIAAGAETFGEGRTGRFVAAASGVRGEAGRPWYLVAHAPQRALERFSASLRSEAIGVGFLLLATTAAVFGLGYLFLRLSVAEARLEAQRAAERRLAEAERLAALGRLTAGVAHEINNPLAGISNYLALLEREGDAPERRREYVGFLRHGFERLATIARDLLAVAHPPTPRREPVELGEVLDRVERIVRHDRGFEKIAWRRDLGEDLLPAAADAFGLEQVFLNLALNARDAMGEGGTILVRARRSGAQPGGIEVRFEDTGRGIPPEALGRIFEPFFSTRGGTGLGLSVSASIVRAHGGSIRAENRPEGGARFVLLLPASAAAPAALGTTP